ncbi:MAG: hypothetical protein ABJB61_01555 [bacterium]
MDKDHVEARGLVCHRYELGRDRPRTMDGTERDPWGRARHLPSAHRWDGHVPSDQQQQLVSADPGQQRQLRQRDVV